MKLHCNNVQCDHFIPDGNLGLCGRFEEKGGLLLLKEITFSIGEETQVKKYLPVCAFTQVSKELRSKE